MAIGADRLHYVGDLAVNLAVVAALCLLQRWAGQSWFDPVFAIGIASGLSVTAFHIARQALNALMDHEVSDTDPRQNPRCRFKSGWRARRA